MWTLPRGGVTKIRDSQHKKMSDRSGESSMWAKVGSASAKYGASAGKRFAQSEAGKAAGRAAVKGATQAASDEMCDRYFGGDGGGPASPPPKQTTQSSKEGSSKPSSKESSSKSSAPPPSTTSSSHHDKPRPQKEDGDWKDSAGQKWSDFSGKMKGAASGVKDSASGKYQQWKDSREPRFTGPTQTPESAQDRAQALLSRRRVKTAAVREADWDKLPLVEALYNFKGELDCDLDFRKGQRIAVLTRTESQNDWWEGRVNDKTGIFPANYVRVP